MTQRSDSNSPRFERGQCVEVTAYHRFRGRYGEWTDQYIAPGRCGGVVGVNPDPDHGHIVYVRFEQGYTIGLYADELRQIPCEGAPRYSENLPTLNQRIAFVRSILEQRAEDAARAARRGPSARSRRAAERVFSEEQAAALVGSSDFSELTDGANGSAQQLIYLLLSADL